MMNTPDQVSEPRHETDEEPQPEGEDPQPESDEETIFEKTYEMMDEVELSNLAEQLGIPKDILIGDEKQEFTELTRKFSIDRAEIWICIRPWSVNISETSIISTESSNRWELKPEPKNIRVGILLCYQFLKSRNLWPTFDMSIREGKLSATVRSRKNCDWK